MTQGTPRHRARTLAIPLLVPLLLLLAAAAVAADYPLTIIDLKHRLPDELIPALAPLAGADGVVTGANASLLIRAAPSRVADIRAALERLDRPARNLLVEVRRAASSQRARAGVGVSVDEPIGSGGRVRIGPGRGTGIRAGAAQERQSQSLLQQVRVLDGGQAFISIGSEQPVGFRDVYVDRYGRQVRRGVDYVSAETGFYVRPRVSGDRVTVALSSRSAQLGNAGRIDTDALDTEVSGRLGEWIPLGAADLDTSARGGTLLSSGRGSASGRSDLELRVRALD
jgi:hypothetical protein